MLKKINVTLCLICIAMFVVCCSLVAYSKVSAKHNTTYLEQVGE